MQRITGYVNLEETSVRGGSENSSTFKGILGDPGTASRDGAIFSVESLFQGQKNSFPPVTIFFVISVPVPSRDSRLPERKRKRLLRRL